MVMPIGCRSLTLGLVYEGFNSGKKILSHFDEYSCIDIKLDHQQTNVNCRLKIADFPGHQCFRKVNFRIPKLGQKRKSQLTWGKFL